MTQHDGLLIWVPPFTSFTAEWWARLYAAHHSAKRISVERKLLLSRGNSYFIANDQRPKANG